MDKKTETIVSLKQKRRSILLIGLLALVYPLLRFIGFRIPAKPRKVEISSTPPATGVLAVKDLILFDRDNKTWAVSRKCTHLGCKLNYHEIGDYLECPCHQSRFSPAGLVVNGPAKRDLQIYEVEKREKPPYYVVTV